MGVMSFRELRGLGEYDIKDDKGRVVGRYVDPAVIERQLSTAYVTGQMQDVPWGVLPDMASLALPAYYQQPMALQAYGFDPASVFEYWQRTLAAGMAPWTGVEAVASQPYLFGMGSLEREAVMDTAAMGLALYGAVKLASKLLRGARRRNPKRKRSRRRR